MVGACETEGITACACSSCAFPWASRNGQFRRQDTAREMFILTQRSWFQGMHVLVLAYVCTQLTSLLFSETNKQAALNIKYVCKLHSRNVIPKELCVNASESALNKLVLLFLIQEMTMRRTSKLNKCKLPTFSYFFPLSTFCQQVTSAFSGCWHLQSYGFIQNKVNMKGFHMMPKLGVVSVTSLFLYNLYLLKLYLNTYLNQNVLYIPKQRGKVSITEWEHVPQRS